MSNVSKKQSFLFKIILASMLIALNVIMERFLSYNVWNMSIGFSFITVGFAAVFLGAPYAVIVAGFGDIIGALLFPFGSYFVGFTLSNMLVGLVLGLFMQKSTNVFKISLAVFINKVVSTLLLNSAFIAILYRNGLDALPAVLLTRIPTAVGTLVVEIIILTLLFDDKSHIKKMLKGAFSSLFV
jgi:ECF transporter S component (folate family)